MIREFFQDPNIDFWILIHNIDRQINLSASGNISHSSCHSLSDSYSWKLFTWKKLKIENSIRENLKILWPPRVALIDLTNHQAFNYRIRERGTYFQSAIFWLNFNLTLGILLKDRHKRVYFTLILPQINQNQSNTCTLRTRIIFNESNKL